MHLFIASRSTKTNSNPPDDHEVDLSKTSTSSNKDALFNEDRVFKRQHRTTNYVETINRAVREAKEEV